MSKGGPKRRPFFVIRSPAPLWQRVLLGLLSIAMVFVFWWYLTRGIPEERIVSPVRLASPEETIRSAKSLWFERALTRNTFATLRRVFTGFSLAVLVGVPIGVVSGCFSRVMGFFTPMTIFGRNIPIAALIPLTFLIFGIGETFPVMFIFLACVAFIIADTAHAIHDVDARYIDTAYTLGANRRQVILKVLVPLAMPSVFTALRVLFGLAFGYIMLAEVIVVGDQSPGLGGIINISQRIGPREHIILVLLLIPVIAMAIDRALYWTQKQLFPHQFGGAGLLRRLVRVVLFGWEALKGLFWSRGKRADPAKEDGNGDNGDNGNDDSTGDPDGGGDEPTEEAASEEPYKAGLGEEKVAAKEIEPAPEEPVEPDPRSKEAIEDALEHLKREMGLISGEGDDG